MCKNADLQINFLELHFTPPAHSEKYKLKHRGLPQSQHTGINI